MNVILKILASALLLVSLGIFIVLFLMLDNYPLIVDEGLVSSAEFQQTLSFIEKSDPRSLQSGSITSFTVREEDMQLFLNYMLEVARNGAAEVNISDGLITTLSSVKMPPYLLERYLNLQITMSSNNESLAIERVKLGKLEFPIWFANSIIEYAHYELRKKTPEYAEILSAIENYKIIGDEVIITYQWKPELIELLSNRGRDLLIEDDDKERLRVHTLRLAEIISDPALPTKLSLVELLGPMFEFAQSRNGDPVEENGAAIMAMALYVMDTNIAKLLGSTAGSISLKHHQITLSGREDFAKHFITSAAITISASTSVADSFGIVKEIEDASAGGSGFSFTDVGADRAGVRFAELAVSNSQNAVLLQEKLSGNIAESTFIPDLTDLPEFMSEDEFLEKFGGVNQPEFQAVIEDIEKRISQLPLFNSL